MKRVGVRQHDISDCGAACLSSIAAHYGIFIPISRLRQMASTDKKGTSILGLINASEKLGFIGKGVKSLNEDGTNKIEPLYNIPLPAIAHIIVGNKLQHYVVVYRIDKKSVLIMDPEFGKLTKWSIKKFMSQWTGILVLIVPGDDFETYSEKTPLINRLIYLLKPHMGIIIQSIFGALIYTILGLSTSIFVQKIVDYVIPNSNRNLVNLMGIVMISILVLSLIINFCKSLFILKTGQLIDARLILGYYKHLLKLPQDFFDSMKIGEIISRIGDAVKIRVFINNTLISIIVGLFTVILAFCLMFTYYWKLAIIILTIIPIQFIVYFIYNRANKKTQRALMEDAAELESQLIESISSIRTIKCFGIEDIVNGKTESFFIRLLNTGYKSGINSIRVNSATSSISQLFTIILLWSGSYFVLDKEITTGELLSFYALLGFFLGPIGSLIAMNITIQDALIAADRLFEIFDLEKERKKENRIAITTNHIGDICFEGVDFSYGCRSDVFKNLDLVFKKGKITAIIGESGSGKSTIASLIQNIYTVSKGSIRIGKFDIRHVEIDSLRKIIGIVPQRLELFNGSITENIALADYNPNMERIFEICISIGLLEFIEKLPDGFSTNIGENGVRLSGGQRQRIAIARALYKNPEIIIFDEATSSLDTNSEIYIKNIISSLKQSGKTIIIIAHRIGFITDADNIIILSEGKVVDQGTHMNLLNSSNYYRQLVKS